MKIQIRHSVFETNSSTNHTLAIRKPKFSDATRISREVYSNCFIVLGETPFNKIKDIASKSPINIAKLDIKTKLDILYWSAFSNYCVPDAIQFLSNIEKALHEVNITVRFTFEKFEEDYFEWGIFSTLSEWLNSKEDILNFLFSDDAWYTCWCDECCGEPNEEEAKVEDYVHSQPKEEMTIYYERK